MRGNRILRLLLVAFFTIQCGVVAASNGRIYGGNLIDITQAPYMASIVILIEQFSNGTSLVHQCGGTILRPNLILTAAHCNVDEDTRKAYKAEQFFVNVGTNNNDLTGGTLHRVKRVFVHPKFKNGGPDYVFHDVGLLELSSAVQFNNRTQPVKLARRKDRPKIGAECTITGYGFNPDVEHNKHLYQVHINVIIAEQCVKELEKDSTAREVNKHEICAKAKSKNQCQGDSGGPMHDVSTGRQVGIVSHGAADCTGDKPSVLTRVTDVWDYIESVIFTTRWQTDKNPITETQNKPQTLPFTPNSSMLNTL